MMVPSWLMNAGAAPSIPGHGGCGFHGDGVAEEGARSRDGACEPEIVTDNQVQGDVALH